MPRVKRVLRDVMELKELKEIKVRRDQLVHKDWWEHRV